MKKIKIISNRSEFGDHKFIKLISFDHKSLKKFENLKIL